MSRSLRSIGVILLSATACLLAADAMGWVASGSLDLFIDTGWRAGAVCLVAGFGLGLLGRMQRGVAKGRCARCRKPIERGQAYCRDHLQAAVNEYRDQLHDGSLHPRRRS